MLVVKIPESNINVEKFYTFHHNIKNNLSIVDILKELTDKEIIQSYVREHFEHGEQSISASIHLLNMDFEDWIYYVHSLQSEGADGWGWQR